MSAQRIAPGPAPGAGSVALNVIWLLFSGIWLALAYVFFGIFQCLFIITIPFGVQSFKLAGFALWPFGRAVVKRPNRSHSLSLIGNVLWFFFAGIWLALAHLFTGVLLCLTVIGIPLGLGNFKMIPFALVPFGKDIVKRGDEYDEFVAF
ncbi:MAG TPA: YccF domain-containing protein [Acidimicrobiales bacterium]|nr:YccF domain-containing protein [Acidimicrobiales bacterium]